MKTRKELFNYFTKSYKAGGLFSELEIEKILSEKATKQLQAEYDHIRAMELEKENILENGLTTYTLSYNMHGQLKTDEQQLIKFLRKNKIYSYDGGKIRYQLRIGGNCIIGIPEKFMQKIESNFPNIKVIDPIQYLGKQCIKQFKVGDKVKIKFNNWHGNSTEQGTVHTISDNEIAIRKYRARTTGLTFNAGDECNIEKIKSFQKVS